MTNIRVHLAQRLRSCIPPSTTINQSLLDKKHTGGRKTNKITGIVAIADNEKFIKDYYTKMMSEERRNQFKTEQNSQWPKME